MKDASAIRAALRDLRDALPVSDDSELISIGAALVAFHLEAGASSFKDCAQMLVADVGDRIIPYLRCFYVAACLMPDMEQFAQTRVSYVRSLSEADVRAILRDPPSAPSEAVP